MLALVAGYLAFLGATLPGIAGRLGDSASEMESRLASFRGGSLSSLGDLSEIGGAVDRIRGDLGSLRRRAAPVLVAAPAFGWVPYAGARLTEARAVLPVVETLAETVGILASVGEETRDGLRADPLLLDGFRANPSAVQRLVEMSPALREAASGLLEAAAEIDALPQGVARGDIGRRLVAVRDELQEAVDLLLPAADLLDGLPMYLGFDGPRTYLLVAMNRDELRPGGGYIPGAWTVVADQGRIHDPEYWDTFRVDDFAEALRPAPPEGIVLSMFGGEWFFRDAAWFPDFPTSAHVMASLFRVGSGIVVDGVVALDQVAVARIVDAIGSLELPDGTQLSMDDFPAIVEVGTDEQGREFMDALLAGILQSLATDLESQAQDLLATAQDLMDQKHLLVHFDHPAIQRFVEELELDGAVDRGTGDYLLVADSNVGFNKVNKNVDRRVRYQVDLGSDGQPEAELEVIYTNRSPPDDAPPCDYQSIWLGTILRQWQGRSTYEELSQGCYWNYLRVYVPANSTLRHASPFPLPDGALYQKEGYDDLTETFRVFTEHGHRVFSGLTAIDPGTSRSLGFRYTLPTGVVERADGGLTYTLVIQKQPGAGRMPVSVEVIIPRDHALDGASPAPSEVDGGTARFDLDLNSDVTLVVRTRAG